MLNTVNLKHCGFHSSSKQKKTPQRRWSIEKKDVKKTYLRCKKLARIALITLSSFWFEQSYQVLSKCAITHKNTSHQIKSHQIESNLHRSEMASKRRYISNEQWIFGWFVCVRACILDSWVFYLHFKCRHTPSKI